MEFRAAPGLAVRGPYHGGDQRYAIAYPCISPHASCDAARRGRSVINRSHQESVEAVIVQGTRRRWPIGRNGTTMRKTNPIGVTVNIVSSWWVARRTGSGCNAGQSRSAASRAGVAPTDDLVDGAEVGIQTVEVAPAAQSSASSTALLQAALLPIDPFSWPSHDRCGHKKHSASYRRVWSCLMSSSRLQNGGQTSLRCCKRGTAERPSAHFATPRPAPRSSRPRAR